MALRIDPGWVSPERFAEYQAAASGDPGLASRLYEWNAEVSAALFEVIHHFEVLLRNAIVDKVSVNGQVPSMVPGTPWIQGAKQIDEVAGRLKKRGTSITPGRIYSGLTFGFWQNMFGPEYEELWRHALQYVFPHGRVDRSVIASSLDSVNWLRNRIAHHGSLIEYATEVETAKIIRLAGWIDPAAAAWISSVERVSALAQARPVAPARNVIIVPAEAAWHLYGTIGQHVYLCPVGRSVRVVDRIAFYSNQEIQPIIPKIVRHDIAVDWNKGNAARLAKSPDPLDKKLAGIIRASQAKGWNLSMFQVFLLTGPKDPDTIQLATPIAHSKRGRGSAFAQGHRYHSLGELLSAKDTSDLP